MKGKTSKKDKKQLLVLLGIAGVGYLAYWMAKHYRKGTVIVPPLDTGSFVTDNTTANNTTTNPSTLITAPQLSLDVPVNPVDLLVASGGNGVTSSDGNGGNAENSVSGTLQSVGPFDVMYRQPTMSGFKKRKRIGINKQTC
jgi:hypothetical protein